VLPPDAERIARRHSNATRELDRRPETFDTHIRYPVADALRDRMRSGDVRAAEDDDKLFAAIAPDDIRLPQLRLDRRDDRVQTRIPGRVSERIVDLLARRSASVSAARCSRNRSATPNATRIAAATMDNGNA
jgi:hypothetical protein